MPTVREYFVKEAADYLQQLRLWLDAAGAGQPDAAALQRICRSLRGSAQIAREERVQRAAGAFEEAARALAAGRLSWNQDAAERAAATLEDLRELVGGGEDAEGDRLADAVVERWGSPGSAAAGSAAPRGGARSERGADASEFTRYAAGEAAGVLGELDSALKSLTSDPLDREPLKRILRRQRALLGAVQLEAVPALARTLQALDDVSRQVAKTGAAVTGEWLSFYRQAREVLAATVPALERGQRTAAVDMAPLIELSERLTQPADGEAPPPSSPAAAGAAGPPPQNQPVPIEELLYRGDAALERALELRPFVERAVRDDAEAEAAVEELFDLIRLGRA